MKERIQSLLEEIKGLSATHQEMVEKLRVKYLGKKGEIAVLFEEFRLLPPEEKREIGQLLNELKNAAQDKVAQLKASLMETVIRDDVHDLTRTASPIEIGTRHPISLVKDEIIDIFSRIGFTVAEGPEIEDDWHVFGALNFPPEHPARDMQDTFFIEQNPDIVLRTHTSSYRSA